MRYSPSAFYVTKGTLPYDALSYVRRDADEALLHALLHGEYCYILTGRQMGKSSLMVRTALRLQEQGRAVAVVDLSALGYTLTADQWYYGLLGRIGRQLDCEEGVELLWDKHARMAPLQRWMQVLEEVIMASRREIILFLDEIDLVRKLSFPADEFFAALRECFNRRGIQQVYRSLTVCLIGVASPSDLVRDSASAPFNIGKRIELRDFRENEAALLAQGLGGTAENQTRVIRRILYWTQGHPYLTQSLCQAVAEETNSPRPEDVDMLCTKLFLEPGALERDDNLLFVQDQMLRGGADVARLFALYHSLWKGQQLDNNYNDPEQEQLRLSGISRIEREKHRLRNPIYRHVFSPKWMQSCLPTFREEAVRKRRFRRRYLLLSALFPFMVAIPLARVYRHKATNAIPAPQPAKRLWEWEVPIHPGDKDSEVKAITTDSLGNIYVAGIVDTEQHDVDYLILKISPTGTLLWERRYNGPGNDVDRARSIAVDTQGNVYITGDADNGKGKGTQRLKGLDIVTLKYDTNGNLLWKQTYNGEADGEDDAVKLLLGKQGEVYVVGNSWQGAAKDQGNEMDVVFIKYSSDGKRQWVRTYEDADTHLRGNEIAKDAAIDNDGNINIVGGGPRLTAGKSTVDALILKYDTHGTRLKYRYFQGLDSSGNDAATHIVTNGNGDCLVAGYFYNGDWKQGSQGQNVWAILMNDRLEVISRNNEVPTESDEVPLALSLNSKGEYYALTAHSRTAFHVTLYGRGGGLTWKKHYQILDWLNSASALAMDADNNVYASGLRAIMTKGQVEKLPYLVKFSVEGVILWEMAGGFLSGYGREHLVLTPDKGVVTAAQRSAGNKRTIILEKFLQ